MEANATLDMGKQDYMYPLLEAYSFLVGGGNRTKGVAWYSLQRVRYINVKIWQFGYQSPSLPCWEYGLVE